MIRRVVSVAFVALLAILTSMCSTAKPTSDTTIRVTSNFDDAWSLTQLRLKGKGHDTTVPRDAAPMKSGTSVVVRVEDEMVGQPIELAVWGLHNGEQVAHGKGMATPILHANVDVDITLSHLPCGAWCTAGVTSCSGNGVKACTQHTTDACFEWSAATQCPKDAPFCSLGRCATKCVDECSEGSARCAGPGVVQRCGHADADACFDWLPTEPCAAGTHCESGVCTSAPCKDECKAGATQCSGLGTTTCGQFDADSCLEWGPQTACPNGETCSNGVCSSKCQDECSISTCTGLVWKQCGHFDFDPCTDLSPGTSCAPSNTCLQGKCDPTAGCSSAPLVCSAPPKNECISAGTMRVFQTAGACANGTCDYTSKDIACPNCPACDACAQVTCNTPPTPSACYQSNGTCAGGSCSYAYANGATCDDGNACTTGDTCASGACAGQVVACNTPPATTCVSATTLRTFSTPGTCGAGTCTYAPVDTVCANGCAGGVCAAPSPVTSLAAGDQFTCAVKSGAAKCWGTNVYGELGDGTRTNRTSPVNVSGGLSSGVMAVSTGGHDHHTCALVTGGGVKCWGQNTLGQLGDGSTTDSNVPINVSGLASGVLSISAGGSDTCAVATSGSAKCWGDNVFGQLGNQSTRDSYVPVEVSGLTSGVTSISVKDQFACAVVLGAARCWGFNGDGELGNNSQVDSHAPVYVSGLTSGVASISVGSSHACALNTGGDVMCWGRSDNGELGNGSTAWYIYPVNVTGLSSGVVAISVGTHSTCALMNGGTVKCWGLNYPAVPLDINGLSSVTSISVGTDHACALTTVGSVKCWGNNSKGQLGNGTTTDSSVPVDVAGL